MDIHVRGASENNLKDIDVDIKDGLTVITGISGSGKTSLVFDTLYHEARRRFLDIFSTGPLGTRLPPARVRSITGLGPTVAVGQNLLNRNPFSTLATASGLHPFLRLLYARFGERRCPRCGSGLSVLTEDEIIEKILTAAGDGPLVLSVPLVRGSRGSHRTLLGLLEGQFGSEAVTVDGRRWDGLGLRAEEPHDIDIEIARVEGPATASSVRGAVRTAGSLGANALILRGGGKDLPLARAPVCHSCGFWFGDLGPSHFHRPCPSCNGKGCPDCGGTGLHPEAASVRWQGLRFSDLLSLPIDDARSLFKGAALPGGARRLRVEIERRLDALHKLGLGYIALDRPSPTLSRGESQRVRLAVALTSRLEDIIHVLDEPTIGQHPADVARTLPAFRELLGPVVFVEHDRAAVAAADEAIDLGPGAGDEGGRVIFKGRPVGLWKADTPSGRYFSLRERVPLDARRPPSNLFLSIRGAHVHNLRDVDIRIPLGRLTVITGVSGSGKSSLVDDVLFASLKDGRPVGCRSVEGPHIKPILVDQSPIGRNPRSNPATYTKLSDVVRDLFAQVTGLSASHFSFNRPEGACPTCKGLGAVEVQLRYLPSTWIRCSDCEGLRFTDEVLSARVTFGERKLTISDFYGLSVSETVRLLSAEMRLPPARMKAARRILQALQDIGLGYLKLGQPSPTLSGGEAQRIKLAKYLGRGSLSGQLLVLDEPSSGLHPYDLKNFLEVLDRLVRAGGTIVVVEHNTDVIRAADWVVDLGPGAGSTGGRVVYSGQLLGLMGAADSATGRSLRKERSLRPDSRVKRWHPRSEVVSIRGARANNLKGVNVDIHKGSLTVVTGVSGSGKSSLVSDVLESEARRRFLETLSMYERQSTSEGPEAPVRSVGGLGVTVTVAPEFRLHSLRSTVGIATEIRHHLAILFSFIGRRNCAHCGESMRRRADGWICPKCNYIAPSIKPGQLSPSNYASACLRCHGLGTIRIPRPEKLIVHPERPLCAGAMYSPGFFPKGYLCKPGNAGYYLVQALANRYGFDTMTTPWDEISAEGKNAFLFGDPKPMEVTFHSPRGRSYAATRAFPGFYGWVRDWDVGGTYTDTGTCPECKGARLRPEYLAVKLDGRNIHEMTEMSLSDLYRALEKLSTSAVDDQLASGSLSIAIKRLGFLIQVGLSYLTLNRLTSTLSAGEAQRVKLASLLGSGLTSLTVLLDEPTRGLHPSEVEALIRALSELRDAGNTVIVVEHDPLVISAADFIIDLGPGPGAAGGRIVAQGRPEEIAKADTVTAAWLRGDRKMKVLRQRRRPRGWLTIRGARENNLRAEKVDLPLGVLIGVCGVSGSGKSTLFIDTLGRALAPTKQTTSVAHEPLEPGSHDSIEGAPPRTLIVDQSRSGIHSPIYFLNLEQPFVGLYAESEDAKSLGLGAEDLSHKCSACGGLGLIRTEMAFLPDVYATCETCRGTGYRPESWDVRLSGLSLPEVISLTFDEIGRLFSGDEGLDRVIKAVQDVGLGYLVLRQPGYSLSGGEAQRLRIAKELSKRVKSETLYILDEPTVGQHMEDVDRLIAVLHRLVDEGHTVLVIEHHPHLLAACDWLVELGPGGGPEGGRVVASGTPEEVAAGDTPSAPYLRPLLRGHK